jgi:hypothetical protein
VAGVGARGTERSACSASVALERRDLRLEELDVAYAPLDRLALLDRQLQFPQPLTSPLRRTDRRTGGDPPAGASTPHAPRAFERVRARISWSRCASRRRIRACAHPAVTRPQGRHPVGRPTSPQPEHSTPLTSSSAGLPSGPCPPRRPPLHRSPSAHPGRSQQRDFPGRCQRVPSGSVMRFTAQESARSRAARSVAAPCAGSTTSTGKPSSGRSRPRTCSRVTPPRNRSFSARPVPKSASESPATTARELSIHRTRSLRSRPACASIPTRSRSPGPYQ